MRVARRSYGIDGNFDVAGGAVFKSDRARKTACKFPVSLAFGCTGADSAPTNQVGCVLRGNRIQKLRCRCKPHFVDVQKEFACNAKPLIDLEAAVHIGVINQSLPTDGRAGFFKIHAHDDFKVGTQLIFQTL